MAIMNLHEKRFSKVPVSHSVEVKKAHVVSKDLAYLLSILDHLSSQVVLLLPFYIARLEPSNEVVSFVFICNLLYNLSAHLTPDAIRNHVLRIVPGDDGAISVPYGLPTGSFNIDSVESFHLGGQRVVKPTVIEVLRTGEKD